MLRYFALTFFAILLTGCYTAPDVAPEAAVSGNYELDPTHTSIIWSLSHVGLSNYSGRFDDVKGTLRFVADAPGESVADIRIKTSSVNTGLPEFDETIAFDSNYFDGKTHPEIRFLTTEFYIYEKGRSEITGDLTFRGITKPVTLDVTFNGSGKSFGHPGDTLGFSAIGKFNRSDFGLTHLKNFGIGDEITLRIETEFNEKRD